jgi:hypothetical protein
MADFRVFFDREFRLPQVDIPLTKHQKGADSLANSLHCRISCGKLVLKGVYRAFRTEAGRKSRH